jgi:hypothetical protein
MLVDDLPLAVMPSAVRWAHSFVEVTLQRWHLGDLHPEAPNVAAELVRNAVAEVEPPSFVVVRLWTLEASRLRIEVWNTSTLPPRDKAGVLSGKQAGYFLPTFGGKVVWAELLHDITQNDLVSMRSGTLPTAREAGGGCSCHPSKP